MSVSLSLHSLAQAPAAERAAWLSPAEHERAQRFVFERDRRRYLAAHCALRERLARHTGLVPQALRLDAAPDGKPLLLDRPDCRFNLSHSGDWALIGISATGELGVDVEALRPIDDAFALAATVFTPAEQEALAQTPRLQRDAAFLRGWTRKEACVKAVGAGLRIDPAGFHAGLDDGPAEIELQLPSGSLVRLRLRTVDAGAHALAAVAWAGPDEPALAVDFAAAEGAARAQPHPREP